MVTFIFGVIVGIGIMVLAAVILVITDPQKENDDENSCQPSGRFDYLDDPEHEYEWKARAPKPNGDIDGEYVSALVAFINAELEAKEPRSDTDVR